MFFPPLVAIDPVVILPSDPRIAYIGRFDWTDRSAPACEWSASEVRLRMHGSTLQATIDDANGCGWEMIVDDVDKGVLALKKGTGDYSIDLGSDGDHNLSLVRRGEAFMGPTRFKGFTIPSGKLLRASKPRRWIEVVGDSITCGYGNEGKDQHEHFKPETENAYESYASVAARQLNAGVTIIAWSGRKMWPNNTTPAIYDCILPTDPKAANYDYKGPAPAAVVINLATNDWGGGAPDKAGWTQAYEEFIRRVWSHYPKAQIYAATGSMMYGAGLNQVKEYLGKVRDDLHDPRVHLIDFDPQKAEDGYGSDWHPSVKTDEKMGSQLADALRHDLKW